MKNTKITLFFLLICCCTGISAQSTNNTKSRRHLERLRQNAALQHQLGNYKNAVVAYKNIISLQPNSFDDNYELALLYYNELNSKRESIPYFLTAIDNMTDTVPDIFNYAGQALLTARNYDKAHGFFQTYNDIPAQPGFLKVSMRRYIARCIEEKAQIEEYRAERRRLSAAGVQVINAGPMINS